MYSQDHLSLGSGFLCRHSESAVPHPSPLPIVDMSVAGCEQCALT